MSPPELASAPGTGPCADPAARVERAVLVGVTALALALRAIQAIRTPVVNPDGAVELELARALAEGRWQDALELHFHPLYAALVALASGLGRLPLEATAQVVSVAVSSLVAPACALAAARLCPERPRTAALVGGLLAALHPYLVRLGGQVMAYALAHACLAWALAFALGAARRGRARDAALAGGAVGLGFLARSDALATGAGLAVGLLIAALAAEAPRPARARRLALPAAFALAALVVMSPYLVGMRLHAGEWRLSLKKRADTLIREALRADPAATPERPRDREREPELRALIAAEPTPPGPVAVAERGGRPGLLASAARALHVSLAAAHALPLALAAAGLLLVGPRRLGLRGRPPGWLLPLLAWGAFLGAHVLLKASWGYTSRTHQSAVGVLVVPLAARGLALLAGLRWRPRRELGLALGLATLLLTPKAIEPQRLHHLAERELGAWLAQHAAERGLPAGTWSLVGHDTRVVAHYARAPFLDVPPGSPAEALAAARRVGARYLAILLAGRAPLRGDLEPALRAAGARPLRTLEAERDRKRYRWLLYEL